MADLNKSDVVRLIGDVLTELDLLMASPDLGDSDFKQVRVARRTLDGVQGKIVAEAFKENTKKFKDAAERLKKVNTDLQQTISEVEKVATTIETIANLISAAEKLLSIATV